MVDAWRTDQISLIVTIENKKPIDLVDLTNSLLGLAEQYRDHIEGLGIHDEGLGKLYVREIRSGSIIAELVSYVQQASALAVTVSPILSFAERSKTLIDWFAGRSKTKPDIKTKEAQGLSKFLGPHAKDSGVSINIQAAEGAEVKCSVTVNGDEAAAIGYRARNFLASERAIGGADIEQNRVFYWYQARGDAKSKVGDLGVIEAITEKPVKVRFNNEEIKQSMIEGPLFEKFYIVDVEVQTVEGRPKLYTILELHEATEKE